MVTDLADAYAACARLARDHYENFPVASRLLPRKMRDHVAAVYAFARIADDFADEGSRPAADRLRLLDLWLDRLQGCAGGVRAADGPGLPPATPHVFAALGSTIRTCGLPVRLLADLVDAFRQDVVRTRYDTWDEVLDYCRRSANPVGRLVLAIAGYRDDRLDLASDAVCTALQLTNFWQDFGRDWRNGRLYVPAEQWRGEGAGTADLDSGTFTPAWRRALRAAAARTAALFEQGRPVCDGVRGRMRLELRLTWLGGRRILAGVERDDFDPLSSRPALGAADVPALLWQALTWRTR